MASGRPTPRLQRRTCRARGARAVRTARDHPAAVRRAVLQAVAHVLGRKAEIACVSFQMTFSFLTDIAFLITASRPIKTWGPVHSDRPLHLDHGRLALVPTWRGPRWCPCHGGGSQAEVVPSRCRGDDHATSGAGLDLDASHCQPRVWGSPGHEYIGEQLLRGLLQQQLDNGARCLPEGRCQGGAGLPMRERGRRRHRQRNYRRHCQRNCQRAM